MEREKFRIIPFRLSAMDKSRYIGYTLTMIRMIALDLDDTLLRSDLSISFRTRSAVKRAAAAGVLVVLASGRVPASMGQFGKLLGMRRRRGYYVCHNGSLIMDSLTGNTLYEIKIPRETALIAYDLAAAEGFPVQIYENEQMYISRSNEYTNYDQKLTGLKQIVVDNFREMAGAGCYKLLVPGDPMLLAPLLSLFQTYLGDDATLFTSKPYFLEVLPPGTDKGAALAWIAAKEGIPREEVMAVGDSMNDEAMIRWAGFGVAMCNGDKQVQAAARLVTPKTNDDDGVAGLIERYVLGRG
ncbi:MAG: Cof-type HAD-IIB family hydrolase [Treponema sp.]|nr:Cof-type HAD-IIB family hydrolase [Treponema sp.]